MVTEALARPKRPAGQGILTPANETKDACLFSGAQWDQLLEGCPLSSPHLCHVTETLAGNSAQAYGIRAQPENISRGLTSEATLSFGTPSWQDSC